MACRPKATGPTARATYKFMANVRPRVRSWLAAKALTCANPLPARYVVEVDVEGEEEEGDDDITERRREE